MTALLFDREPIETRLRFDYNNRSEYAIKSKETQCMRKIGLAGASALWAFDEFGIHLLNMFAWDVITDAMDPTTRKKVAQELPDASNIDFLRRYLELAPSDLYVG